MRPNPYTYLKGQFQPMKHSRNTNDELSFSDYTETLSIPCDLNVCLPRVVETEGLDEDQVAKAFAAANVQSYDVLFDYATKVIAEFEPLMPESYSEHALKVSKTEEGVLIEGILEAGGRSKGGWWNKNLLFFAEGVLYNRTKWKGKQTPRICKLPLFEMLDIVTYHVNNCVTNSIQGIAPPATNKADAKLVSENKALKDAFEKQQEMMERLMTLLDPSILAQLNPQVNDEVNDDTEVEVEAQVDPPVKEDATPVEPQVDTQVEVPPVSTEEPVEPQVEVSEVAKAAKTATKTRRKTAKAKARK